jgi:hypothetical protein
MLESAVTRRNRLVKAVRHPSVALSRGQDPQQTSAVAWIPRIVAMILLAGMGSAALFERLRL